MAETDQSTDYNEPISFNYFRRMDAFTGTHEQIKALQDKLSASFNARLQACMLAIAERERAGIKPLQYNPTTGQMERA